VALSRENEEHERQKRSSEREVVGREYVREREREKRMN
jgi:hypothetical protein